MLYRCLLLPSPHGCVYGILKNIVTLPMLKHSNKGTVLSVLIHKYTDISLILRGFHTSLTVNQQKIFADDKKNTFISL